MPYLIDGHNLIPKIQGLRLDNLDDEQELIDLLRAFCQRRRQKAEVFFDQAAPGRAGKQSFGLVTAHFVQASSSADEAIQRKLNQLGRQARNWKVVSSDRQVQAEARAAQAEVVAAEDFARLLQEAPQPARQRKPHSGKGLSTSEVEEWLRIFKEDGDK